MASPHPETIQVFISYSHESRAHMDRVLALANRLRADGIDCHIDQYELSPPEGWPRWMIKHIAKAAFVLVVCTETYTRRFNDIEDVGKGLGVKWEGAILTQELHEAEAHNTKFIPVVFSTYDAAYIPIVLRGVNYYAVNTEEGYEALYRRLTNQPRILDASAWQGATDAPSGAHRGVSDHNGFESSSLYIHSS
jgi:TIR domain